ncbi:MAG: hypothetical protein IPL78_01715 [Chloroflexi bacterium]|nr:hypothetical protein [Chloroflexota bacterium]
MTEIRYAPLFRFFSLFASLTFGGLALIGWLAYRQEGETMGLILMWPLLGVGLYWLLALATSPQKVEFAAASLTIHRWVGTKTIPYTTITAVTQSYPFITLHTVQGTIRLHKLYANDDARLMRAFETHIPAAQQARAARLTHPLPLVLKGKILVPFITFFMGAGLLAFGLIAIWNGITRSIPVEAPLGMILFGLISAPFGLLFIYLVLWTWPYRTVFTATQMTERFLLHTHTQPMQFIVDFDMGYEIRTVRSIPRRLYHITFVYQDGSTYQWTPNEFYFPMDYVDNAAANLTTDLTAQLRHAYLDDKVTE